MNPVKNKEEKTDFDYFFLILLNIIFDQYWMEIFTKLSILKVSNGVSLNERF